MTQSKPTADDASTRESNQPLHNLICALLIEVLVKSSGSNEVDREHCKAQANVAEEAVTNETEQHEEKQAANDAGEFTAAEVDHAEDKPIIKHRKTKFTHY